MWIVDGMGWLRSIVSIRSMGVGIGIGWSAVGLRFSRIVMDGWYPDWRRGGDWCCCGKTIGFVVGPFCY